jgi:hypothetical protein
MNYIPCKNMLKTTIMTSMRINTPNPSARIFMTIGHVSFG